MKYKFFNIPVLNAEQAETELNNFCTQHRVAQIEKQFVNNAENSFWALCITWLDNRLVPKFRFGNAVEKFHFDYLYTSTYTGNRISKLYSKMEFGNKGLSWVHFMYHLMGRKGAKRLGVYK